MRGKRAENFGKNCHVFPYSRKVKGQIIYFIPEEDRSFIFSFFKTEYLFPKSASPPPSESNGCPLKKRTLC